MSRGSDTNRRAWSVARRLALVCVATMFLEHDGGGIASAKEQKRDALPSCEARNDRVAFFQDKDFKGACTVRGIGNYRDAAELGIRNDQLTSMRVGSGMQVVVCRDKDFQGNCQLFTADEPNLGKSRIGSDKVSSARVQVRGQQDCKPGPKQVALFTHGGFLAPCEIKEIGDHPDLAPSPEAKGSISSILVGQDVQAVLCRHPSFKGDCELFATSDSSLGDNRIGNDKASSLKVQPRGFEECVPKADEASLFEHRTFLAPCVVKKVGDYANAAEIGLIDNGIAAMRIGATVQVCACENEAFAGMCSVFTKDVSGVGASTGIISSVKVQAVGAECR